MSIIQSLEDAQRVFGELDMWTKAWTDCDGIIRWAEEFSDISLAPPLCHIDRWGALDMWTGAWTDCDGVIRWAEQTEAFKVSHEIEEEEAAELLNKDADIVFKCEACSISIVRNSRAHDHCICDEDGERWWCEDCYDHYQQDGWSSEEEEEDIDICGETGGLLKGFKGCGDKFDTQDTNMLGNTSFCVECYNKHEDTYYKEEDIVETKTQFDVKVST